MFLCNVCEGIFEEATQNDTCPHCNSEEFVEARKCAECDEWVDDNESHYCEEDDKFLCSDCHCSSVNKLSSKEEFDLSEFCRGWDEYVA
ncbi:MAG: hypothetical protein UGF89_00785 [Acutalibacteraceae bacterium]|nr:hypothetical protein [Acutalibacteraceae bacterium]